MSEEIVLQANIRNEKGRELEKLRSEGVLPAVLYGHKIEPKNISVKYLDFSKTYKKAGENTILSLSLDGGKSVNALIHDVQISPLSNRFIHADFFEVRMDEEIETHVPISFVGESMAVRSMGGILIKSVEELLVKALPKDLPHVLEVDLSLLANLDDRISVSDVVAPKGVQIEADASTVLASIMAPRTDAELANLNEKADMDVTKVEGIVKADQSATEEEKKK